MREPEGGGGRENKVCACVEDDIVTQGDRKLGSTNVML